jgi:hypothetical protein
MVAQIDEQHAAMVANAMAPAGQPYGLADVALAERAAGMGPVTMHGFLKDQMSEKSNRELQSLPKARGGFTRGFGARQPNARAELGSKKRLTMPILGA